jgi:hypothetical protein
LYRTWIPRLQSSLCISIRYASVESPQSHPIISHKFIDYYRAFATLFHNGSLRHGSQRSSAYPHGCPGFTPLPAARYVPHPMMVFIIVSSNQTAPDRFQWGSIMSRFIIGFSLVLLLLLNIGQYQEMFVSADQDKKRAGIFLFLST